MDRSILIFGNLIFLHSVWVNVRVSEANKCFENFLTSYFSNSLIYAVEEPTKVVHILDTAFIYNEKLLKMAYTGAIRVERSFSSRSESVRLIENHMESHIKFIEADIYSIRKILVNAD